MSDSEIFTVELMNDSKIKKGRFHHTWFKVIKSDGEEKFFNFGVQNKLDAITKSCKGNTIIDDRVKKRKSQQKPKKISITAKGFENMLKKEKELEGSIYAVTPERNSNQHNCVTYANAILKAANINFLDDVTTPKAVGRKMKGLKYKLIDNTHKTIGKLLYLPYIFASIFTLIITVMIVFMFIFAKLKEIRKRKENRDLYYEQVKRFKYMTA